LNNAGGTQSLVLGATDAGSLIAQSPSVVGVETQKRSPIANETRIRGYHLGQIVTQADGAFWFPARQDLDTFLSKIDSGMIDNLVVLKGPYSARYGPGLAFIDIATAATPRYADGFEWHGRTTGSYKFNGEQIFGRQAIWGGGEDYGIRLSYDQRTGNDYEMGNGKFIPSSYDSRDLNFAFGYDITCNDHLEFGYMRLDQTGLEFPGQIFDTDWLVTNAFRLRYLSEKKEWYDRLTVDTYYNYTALKGDAQHEGKRLQIPQLDQLGFIGFTDIDQGTLGYRVAVTWGVINDKFKEPQITIGHDLRYLDGHLNERDTLFQLAIPCGTSVNFPVPRSHELTVAGLFAEYILPCGDCLTLKFGARGDYTNTNIDAIPPGFDCSTFNQTANQDFFGSPTVISSNYERDFGTWLAYGTAEYKMTPYLTLLGAAGHSERPPTQTELYAMQPFLAILQNGFTTVIGNPNLATEKLTQIDIGMRLDNGWLRGGANAFYSFIEDYITYQPAAFAQSGIKLGGFSSVTNGLTVQFVNTGFATLAGFELYGEADATSWLTPYATVSFVEGRDYDRASHAGVNTKPTPNEEPLPMIPPLEARAGIRIHEEGNNPRYGFEFEARMVARQDRVAESLNEVTSAGFTIFNIRGYWQVNKNFLVTGGADNLFDRFYREHLDLRTGLGVFQPGITPYVGAEVNW
jgi:outer membrane receptor protein involved in Fe transport